MTATWLWARSELRARWRSWVVLGLLGGAVFGLAAAGVAGARRTDSAVPDFATASRFPRAGVLANDPIRDGRPVVGSILHMDPPSHGEWRRVLNRRFTPRAVSPMA